MSNIKIYAFADEASKNIDLQIKALKRNGLNGIEIRNVDGENVADITVQKAKEVKKKFDDAGLSVWSIGSPIGKIDIESDDFSEHTEKFKHVLEIAEILSAPNIRIFSFYIPDGKNPGDYKNEVIDRLSLFAEIASGSNTELCHENEKGIYGDNAERCLDILKAVPKIKGIFDPANFVQCGQDTIIAYEMLGDYIKYMHIKDAVSNGLVVPAGEGEGNVKEIVKRFIAGGGKDFTVEPHLKKFSGLSKLERGDMTAIGADLGLKDNDEVFDFAVNKFKGII